MLHRSKPNTVEELGYVTAIPHATANLGTSAPNTIKYSKIMGPNFGPKLDFEIDRYVIDNTTGNSNEQYIPSRNYSFNV